MFEQAHTLLPQYQRAEMDYRFERARRDYRQRPPGGRDGRRRIRLPGRRWLRLPAAHPRPLALG